MNRRKFLSTLAGAFTILPGAGRIWKVERKLLNPAYVNAPQEVVVITSIYDRLPNYLAHEYFKNAERNKDVWRRIMDDVSICSPDLGETRLIVYRRPVSTL